MVVVPLLQIATPQVPPPPIPLLYERPRDVQTCAALGVHHHNWQPPFLHYHFHVHPCNLVRSMSCRLCHSKYISTLPSHPLTGVDVKNFAINMDAQTVSVETDMEAEEMMEIVKKAGKVRLNYRHFFDLQH